jgi:dihydroneopterin aldolase
MTTETETAFQHPEARAMATAPDGVHDRLSLRDHVVSVEIGAFEAERDVTQRISFDIVVEVTAPSDDQNDDVDKILSYDRLIWAIDHELAAERLNLLETLAERVADRILAEPQALRVFVRIQKLDKGNGKLGVEIVRVPGQGAGQALQDARPAVVYLDNAALWGPALDETLQNLRADDTPMVICLDCPSDVPSAATPDAQRRIDLLAIEQAAWVFAASRADYTVAGTRTELDWALKNGTNCVWAPSKLVLDATDGVPVPAVDMAAWFAQEWNASAFFVIGESLPQDNTIPFHLVTLDQTDL